MTVVCNTAVTAAYVDAADPDVVVVATGARPGRPDVPGADSAWVVDADEAIIKGLSHRGPVTVLDSGEADWCFLTTAEKLASDGHEVHLVCPVTAGQEIDVFSRPPLMRRLSAKRVQLYNGHVPLAIGEGFVEIEDVYSSQVRRLPAETVVLAWFGIADDDLFRELSARSGRRIYAVGDCLAPRRAIDAIWDGFRVGNIV